MEPLIDLPYSFISRIGTLGPKHELNITPPLPFTSSDLAHKATRCNLDTTSVASNEDGKGNTPHVGFMCPNSQ